MNSVVCSLLKMRHNCILEMCCFSAGVYFVMDWEILTGISRNIDQYYLWHGMGLVRLLHPMGSSTSNSGRKSHLYGIIHISNFPLETASWSKLKFKCNKHPLEITNYLSTLVELIVKINQLNPLTDFADAWNQPEHYSPSDQWIIHVLRLKNPKETNPRCVNICV